MTLSVAGVKKNIIIMKKILKTIVEEFLNQIIKAIEENPFYIWEEGDSLHYFFLLQNKGEQVF